MGPIFMVVLFLNATGALMQGQSPAQYSYTKLTDCQAVATNLNTIKNGTVNRVFAFCVDTTPH